MRDFQKRLKGLDTKLKVSGVPIRLRKEITKFYPNKTKKINLPNDKGAFLHGEAGTGKTIQALSLILDRFDVLSKYKPDLFVFGNVNEILYKIKQTYNSKYVYDGILDPNTTPEDMILRKYTEPKYLLLDDLGVEKTTEFTNQTLYLIINRRYENEKITFTTSNLSPTELEEKMEDGRIISRLKGDSLVFKMTKQYRN